MIVPLNWLRDYIDFEESPQEVAQAFTSIGYMLDRPIAIENETAVLDLEVRQNRPDCLSMIGLARELGAILSRNIRTPDALSQVDAPAGSLQVEVVGNEVCQRFFALTLENITVGPSPEWLSSRLATYGIKSINNIVDITNFVAVEYGQPMHAYDADKVKNRHIIVRHAHEGESLTLFGGKTVHFDKDDIIHADSDGPIGFGALMGGEEKSVHEDTTSIILEAAVYNQASVRRSSRRHAIRTEASTRLEKFLHPELVEIALKRAVHLVAELANGSITEAVDHYPNPKETLTVLLHTDQIERLAGIRLNIYEVEDILNRLELFSERTGDSMLTVSIPYFRTDIEQEADLVEEVVRIHGYSKIPEKLPHAAPPIDLQSTAYTLEEKIRDVMTALGYDEVITEPLTFESAPAREPVKLENSLTSEKTMLRTTMLASLQTALQERKKYRSANIRLFEIGKIYYKQEDTYVEQRTLGLITAGEYTYLHIKGDLQIMLDRLGISPDVISGESFGDISSPAENTWNTEVNLDTLFKLPQDATPRVISTPPQFIFHDFVLNVPADGNVTKIVHEVKKVDPIIRTAEYIRTQRSDESKKEIIIQIGYSQDGKKLSEADVAPVREKILQRIKELE